MCHVSLHSTEALTYSKMGRGVDYIRYSNVGIKRQLHANPLVSWASKSRTTH